MDSDRSWFRGPPLYTISFNLGAPSKWEVIEKVNENALQLGESELEESVDQVFYACIKYRRQNWNDKAHTAYIRVWKQIPHFETEIDDPDIRARQAKPKWIPQELTAYKELTEKNSDVTPRLLGWSREQQDGSGLVPGGFLVSLAWEEVPGTQLGDQLGSGAFWQHQVKTSVTGSATPSVTISKLRCLGYEPLFARGRNLVWDSTSNTLFMVGFREWSSAKPMPWSEVVFSWFGLVKIPGNFTWSTWDGDTSSWEF
ncbi:hypothetical protein PENNAL_c0016G09623 [Penicillium nalgiovense]|uniref:Uncharacterized protein n=1 Tax=Penicillium nalgiovense TaxID=60175 RepID=A0A1V6YMC1_PENNA|nr:hypothetical protein PENNAL_c0016G09623 [Penicillium nalgiovense]